MILESTNLLSNTRVYLFTLTDVQRVYRKIKRKSTLESVQENIFIFEANSNEILCEVGFLLLSRKHIS